MQKGWEGEGAGGEPRLISLAPGVLCHEPAYSPEAVMGSELDWRPARGPLLLSEVQHLGEAAGPSSVLELPGVPASTTEHVWAGSGHTWGGCCPVPLACRLPGFAVQQPLRWQVLCFIERPVASGVPCVHMALLPWEKGLTRPLPCHLV